MIKYGDLGFTGETLLPLDADAGEYYVSYFFVTDLALNDNKYYKAELSEFKIDSNTDVFSIDSVEPFGDGYILTWHQGGNILLEIFN